MKTRPPQVNLNLNVRGLRPSATLAINERSNALRAQGRQVFKLGLGQSPFPVPEEVVERLRQHAHEKDYLPVKGLPILCEAVADYHLRIQGLERQAEDVIIGPGSKELMFILQLVYYGDLVIPTPSWVSYQPQARIIGRQVHWVPTYAEDGWRLTPDALEAICHEDLTRPRLVILNYPSNPTGDTYRLERLKALARVAREHRVILLSDEIYGELHHRGQHVSIARFYPEGTIVGGGLSKWCGAGGWRLGTFVFPRELKWLRDAMAVVASETFTSTSAPIQYAAVCAFQGSPAIQDYLANSRRVLRALGRHVAQRLAEAGATLHPPKGAFYLFPDFSPLRERLVQRGITTGAKFCEQLLNDTGVAMLPGSDFGRPVDELTARLAYVDFHGGRVLEAAGKVPVEHTLDVEFLVQYCPNVVTAIERVCEWVSE